MSFLRASFASDPPALIRGEGVNLRMPQISDYGPWAEMRQKSRAHLVPWEPMWTSDELSRSTFRLRVRIAVRESRDDLGYAFLLFRAVDGELIGGLTLSHVRRGVSQSASLGYWMGLPFVRNGYMRAGVAAALGYAFESLRLHRVEAACLPANTGSIRVLESNGFVREGFAERYLRINGVWRDHLLYARLGDDQAAAPRSTR